MSFIEVRIFKEEQIGGGASKSRSSRRNPAVEGSGK
jgi:hypothetical protein